MLMSLQEVLQASGLESVLSQLRSMSPPGPIFHLSVYTFCFPPEISTKTNLAADLWNEEAHCQGLIKMGVSRKEAERWVCEVMAKAKKERETRLTQEESDRQSEQVPRVISDEERSASRLSKAGYSPFCPSMWLPPLPDKSIYNNMSSGGCMW